MRSLAAYAVLAVALTFSLAAAAAEEEEAFALADSAAAAELQRQVALPPPAAAGPRELCVFLHKRGTAHLRLGMNDKALADLKEALALKQRGATDLWCDRWRLQIDIRSAISANADWLELAEYAKSVGEEYRDGNKWRYSETQYWLVDANVFLGRLREAEQAFRRVGDLLPELRQHKAWPVYGSSRLGRHDAYTAWMQELRGNYAEAERYRRQALRHAREYLDTMRANRSAQLPGQHLGTKADTQEWLFLLQGNADPVDLARNPVVRVIGAHRAAEDHRTVMPGQGLRQGLAKARPADVEVVAALHQVMADPARCGGFGMDDDENLPRHRALLLP